LIQQQQLLHVVSEAGKENNATVVVGVFTGNA
jgi:hypothetical protein